MEASHTGRRGRVALALVVGAALAVGLWLVASLDGGGRDEGLGPVAPAAGEDAPAAARALTTRAAAALDTDRAGAVPATLPSPDVEPAQGDDVLIPREGRTASLVLKVTRQGLGIAAELHVLAGAEAGRQWSTDADGQLELRDLLPGVARVEVRAAGGWTCRRELALRHGREANWELDFGDHGRVTGHVRDADGLPLADARLELDGVEVSVRADGSFDARRHASGAAQLVARHERFVDQLHRLPGEPGASTVELSLPRGGRLVVSAPGLAELGDQAVDVLLSPRGAPVVAMGPGSAFPWAHLPPLRVPAGGRLVLEGLPTTQVQVLAWHPRARARPLSGWVSPERPCELALELEPLELVHGRVLRDGEPVADAPVRAVFANPARERKQALGAHGQLSDRVPVALPAHVDQQLRSDADGRFELGLHPDHPRPLYVSVGDPRGGETRTRRVDVGDVELVVELPGP